MAGRVPRGLENHEIAHAIGFRERFDRAALEADLGEVGGSSGHGRRWACSAASDRPPVWWR